jgi:hypothetical protein
MAEAVRQARSFSGYAIIGNSCGIWARDVMTVSGSGIRTEEQNFEPENGMEERMGVLSPMNYIVQRFTRNTMRDNAPNSIGDVLKRANEGRWREEELR